MYNRIFRGQTTNTCSNNGLSSTVVLFIILTSLATFGLGEAWSQAHRAYRLQTLRPLVSTPQSETYKLRKDIIESTTDYGAVRKRLLKKEPPAMAPGWIQQPTAGPAPIVDELPSLSPWLIQQPAEPAQIHTGEPPPMAPPWGQAPPAQPPAMAPQWKGTRNQYPGQVQSGNVLAERDRPTKLPKAIPYKPHNKKSSAFDNNPFRSNTSKKAE
jgi:hypothetical protein